MKSILEWPAADPISRSRSPRKALVYAHLHRARETEQQEKEKEEKSMYEVIDVCYVYTDACVQSLCSIDVRANFRARRGTRERD